MTTIHDGEYNDCMHCGGSGDDETDPLGRCIFCNGTGEVWVEYRDEDDEDDASAT